MLLFPCIASMELRLKDVFMLFQSNHLKSKYCVVSELPGVLWRCGKALQATEVVGLKSYPEQYQIPCELWSCLL